MDRVFVTQETNFDFSGAEAWGPVQFLTKDDFHNAKGSLVNEALMRQLRLGLSDFDPERDHVVIAGSPYVAAAVFMILGEAHHKRIKVLRWDNRDLVYRSMCIDMEANYNRR